MDQQNNLFLQQFAALQEQTLSPTALADRELTVLWANKAAQTQYPRLTAPDGLTFFFGDEGRKQQALSCLENEHPYLCPPSLPLMDRCLFLTPIIGPGNTHYTQVAFFSDHFPVPEDCKGSTLPHPAHAFSRQITNTAQKISAELKSLYNSLDTLTPPLPVASEINRSFNRLQRNAFHLNRSARNMEAFYNSFYLPSPIPDVQTNLSAFLQEICNSTEILANKVGHRFTAVLPEHPVPALVDQEELSLALYNGISNALHFAQLGERIVLTLQEKDSMLEFSIANSNGGLPVPESILRRAFDPFFSQNPAVDQSFSQPVGLGLGLSVVQSFAANHGGTASLHCAGSQTVLTFSIAWLQKSDHPLQLFDSSYDMIRNPYSLYNVMLSEVIPQFDEIDPLDEADMEPLHWLQ